MVTISGFTILRVSPTDTQVQIGGFIQFYAWLQRSKLGHIGIKATATILQVVTKRVQSILRVAPVNSIIWVNKFKQADQLFIWK